MRNKHKERIVFSSEIEKYLISIVIDNEENWHFLCIRHLDIHYLTRLIMGTDDCFPTAYGRWPSISDTFISGFFIQS